jgi:hypothetical protein
MSLELEPWEQGWEKTRKRGQLPFVVLRGAAYGVLWFLINIVLNGFSKEKMPYPAMVLVSLFFFVVGCSDARSRWNRAERRYRDAIKIRDSMIEDASRQTQ